MRNIRIEYDDLPDPEDYDPNDEPTEDREPIRPDQEIATRAGLRLGYTGTRR